MAQQTELEFMISAHTKGMEQIDKLMRKVSKLEKEMKGLQGATTNVGGGLENVTKKIRGNTNVLDAQSKSLRRQRQGMQQVGMQINDFATSVSTGASVTTAFNQQIGQLGYAMSLLQGRAGAVGRFLAGPWGAALTVAAMLLGQFAEGLFESEESSIDLKKALDFQKMSSEDLIEVTQKLSDANKELTRTSYAAAAAAADKARQDSLSAEAAIDAAEADLLSAQAMLAKFGPRSGFRQQVIEERKRVVQLEGALAQARGQVARTAAALERMNLSMTPNQRAIANLEQTLNVIERMAGVTGEFTPEMRAMQSAVISQIATLRGLENATTSSTSRQKEQNEELTEGAKLVDAYFESLKAFGGGLRLESLDMTTEQVKNLNTLMSQGSEIEKDATAKRALQIAKQKQDILDFNRDLVRSFESIGQNISNVFKGLITGAESFGSAIKSIISSVIDELFRLFVVQQIVGMVSGALGNVTGTSSTNAGGGAKLGFATGGYPAPGKPAIVGERGPELFVPTSSGKIIPNHQLNSGGGMTINVDARGSTDPEAVRQQVERGILEAAPSIVAAAQNQTISTLRRPRLAGTL